MVESPARNQDRLSFAISPCPNDIYIFAGLILHQVAWEGTPPAFEFADIETCNQAARQGRYDVIKISYACYPLTVGEYELLDSGGALGHGVGPLLLVNGTGGFDPENEVLVPGEHTTAHFLLDFFIRSQKQGIPLKKRFLPFDTLYQELCNQPGAQGVVIHEKRFTYARDGLTLLQDLGEHWERETGHPIPLGAIVARRSLGQKNRLEDAIRRSLAWAEEHPARALELCREHARDFTESVMRSHIELYVNGWTRELGEQGQAAVAHFLQVVNRTEEGSSNV